MARLFTSHSKALAAAYADVENQALAQEEAFLATPGSLLERTNAGGFRYYALQQYGHDGIKKETYLAGPVGDAAADRAAAEMRARIREQRDVIGSLRLLMREGYGFLEPKHYAVIAALGHHGVFSAGGVLVGTHAFEVILNRLGIRASAFATTDVDVARAGKLGVKNVPKGGLLEILRATGECVPELKAHATALPYFRYLISETQPAAAISRAGCVAVRVPVPDKFAVHKLLVSQLRTGKSEKARKDIREAAIIMAALGEMHGGSIEEAFAKAPVSARSKIKVAMIEAGKLLVDHPQALAELEGIVARGSKSAS